MNNKKMYIVSADTYDDAYGAQISLFGVYDELEKAKQRAKELEEGEYYYAQIDEVIMNSPKEIYLGGYIE